MPPWAFRRVCDADPPRPTPRRTLIPPIFILRRERERMRSGGRARVTSFHKERKPAGTVSREEHLLVLALPPYGWRELGQAGIKSLLWEDEREHKMIEVTGPVVH